MKFARFLQGDSNMVATPTSHGQLLTSQHWKDALVLMQ